MILNKLKKLFKKDEFPGFPNNKYDPRDLTPYIGRTYVTKNDSEYTIAKGGILVAPESSIKGIDGAKVIMVAGVPTQYTRIVKGSLPKRGENGSQLEKFLQRTGFVADRDDYLFLFFDESTIGLSNNPGILTSRIKDYYPK